MKLRCKIIEFIVIALEITSFDLVCCSKYFCSIGASSIRQRDSLLELEIEFRIRTELIYDFLRHLDLN